MQPHSSPKSTHPAQHKVGTPTHEKLDEADVAVVRLDHVLEAEEAAGVCAQGDLLRLSQRLQGELHQRQAVAAAAVAWTLEQLHQVRVARHLHLTETPTVSSATA